MPSQRESTPSIATQSGLVKPDLVKLSVGQFAERFRGEVIPLSNTFGYFCATVPMSEELVKEYLEEPVAALPPAVSVMLPKISILLVPYLERSATAKSSKAKRRARPIVEKMSDFVVSERPAEGLQSWASQISFDDETVLLFALKEQDVAEYHYRFYRKLAALVAEKWSDQVAAAYIGVVRDELLAGVHGEVDDDSWQAKQVLLRRQANVKREGPLFADYVKQSFIDTLTLYLHGICCDIDVETGPRQLPSRYLRKRLAALKSLYPAPAGYAVFPEDAEQGSKN
jgi:hypothetical protein